MNQQHIQKNHFATSTSLSGTQQIQRLVQNFFLIWIDPTIDESEAYFSNSLAQLRTIINDVITFKQEDDAIDFLTEIDGMNGFLIISDTIGQQILTLIHDISVLNAIYILITHPHQQWTKIKGMYTDIPSICQCITTGC